MMRRLGDDLRAVAVPFVVVRILVGLGYILARGVHERWYPEPPQAFTEGLVAWDGTFYREESIDMAKRIRAGELGTIGASPGA